MYTHQYRMTGWKEKENVSVLWNVLAPQFAAHYARIKERKK